MNPKGEKIRFQDFGCKMPRLSHQNFKLFQWPKLFLFLEVNYWWHIPTALSTQPQLSHSSLPSYKTHLMLLYGLLAGAAGHVASQWLKEFVPTCRLTGLLQLKKPGRAELGRLSLYSHYWTFFLSNTSSWEGIFTSTQLSHLLLRGSIKDWQGTKQLHPTFQLAVQKTRAAVQNIFEVDNFLSRRVWGSFLCSSYLWF